MVDTIPARKRVVEVIADLGAGQSPHWRYGSGLLVGGRQVLTCAHVVVGAVDVVVRRPDKTTMRAAVETALIGTPDPRGLDLALLEIPDAEDLPYVPIGLINRDVTIGASIDGCAAVGYPAFQEVDRDNGGLSIRETVQVRGSIAPLSSMVENLLSLEVTVSPRELPPAGRTLGQSPWSGMSGAAVLAPDGRMSGGQLLLGVVAEHSPRRGQSDITVLPLDRLMDTAGAPGSASAWWARLGVTEPGRLPRVPVDAEPQISRLHNVPQLPAHFIARPDITSKLKDLLCTGSDRLVGLHGMGGTGKSVIAAVVAGDEGVRCTFDDGVIWITVGQGADIATLLRRQQQVAEALNDVGPLLTDIEQGKARLSTLFQDKACLLILDDVWRVKDVESFGTVGGRCRVLITTRERSVLVNLGAAELRLDVLGDTEALALLAYWADQPPDTLPRVASEVAQECGNLPLALAMVGAMVRGKPDRWANVLHKLRSQDLEKIGRDFPGYPYPNLFRAIQASVEALEFPALRDRYFDFAAFDRNVAVPLTALESFWKPVGMHEFDVEDAVDALVDASLVQRMVDGRLRLHDLQIDYVVKRAGDLLALHNRLLQAYGVSSPPDGTTVPNDGYLLENLSYHLIQAGRTDELHQLLQQENGTGTNAWYARLTSVDPSGALFIKDLARARSAAEAVNAADAEKQQPCSLIRLDMLYALAIASVHSLSSNIPPTLLAALLENRVWTRDQAAAAARQATTLQRRVGGLAAVAALSPPADRTALNREALAMVSVGIGTTDSWIPKEAFEDLVPLLPVELLYEAALVAQSFPEAVDRAETLAQVARHTPEPLRETTLSEAIAAARAVQDDPELLDTPSDSATALLDVADSLPEPERDDMVSEALALARSLSSEDSWRARTLADVADHLAEPARSDVLHEAVKAVRAVQQTPALQTGGMYWTQERAMALTEITPKLPAFLLDEAMTIAYELASPYDRDNALQVLIPRLAEVGKLGQALSALRTMSGRSQAIALADAAERLSSIADLRAVLSAARDVDAASDSHVLARVPAIIAPRLARQGLHAEANSIAETVDDPWLRLQMCAELAQILPPDLRGQAIDGALEAGQSDRVQRFLANRVTLDEEPIMRLALWLAADGQFDHALAAARTFPRQGRYGGAGPRAASLGLLAPHLPDEVRHGELLEALAAAQLVADVYHQASALAAWTTAPAGDPTHQPGYMAESLRTVLAALPTIFDDELRLQLLIMLVPCVPAPLLDASLHIARALERADLRAVALTKIAVRLPAPDRTLMMAEALESVKAITATHLLAPVLTKVLPDFPADQQRYVLQAILNQDAATQRTLLPGICAALPEELKREALPRITVLEDLNARRDTLIQMRSLLSETEQSALLADLASLDDAREVGRAVGVMSANLAEAVLPQAIAVARDLPDAGGRAAALAGLALRLAAVNRLEQAMDLVGEIDWEFNDTDPLSFGTNLWAQGITALAGFFPPGAQLGVEAETLAATPAISTGWVRAQVITALSLFADPSVADGLFQAEMDKLDSAEPVNERSVMLVAMAPRLPERLLPAAMAAACTIGDGGSLGVNRRAAAFAALSKRLPTLPKTDLYRIWRDTLQLMTGHARGDLLLDLAALTPVARALGGEDAAAESIGTLSRIVRWWP